jgi:hypothetical protein
MLSSLGVQSITVMPDSRPGFDHETCCAWRRTATAKAGPSYRRLARPSCCRHQPRVPYFDQPLGSRPVETGSGRRAEWRGRRVGAAEVPTFFCPHRDFVRIPTPRLALTRADFFGFFGALKRGGLFLGAAQKTPRLRGRVTQKCETQSGVAPPLPSKFSTRTAHRTRIPSRTFLGRGPKKSASLCSPPASLPSRMRKSPQHANSPTIFLADFSQVALLHNLTSSKRRFFVWRIRPDLLEWG